MGGRGPRGAPSEGQAAPPVAIGLWLQVGLVVLQPIGPRGGKAVGGLLSRLGVDFGRTHESLLFILHSYMGIMQRSCAASISNLVALPDIRDGAVHCAQGCTQAYHVCNRRGRAAKVFYICQTSGLFSYSYD